MKSRLILVTGGARSGKSHYAEKVCAETSERVAYVATAPCFDEGMVDRIQKHRARRPENWKTFEKQNALHELFSPGGLDNAEVVLIDCLTVLTTNLLLKDPETDWDTVDRAIVNRLETEIIEEMETLVEAISSSCKTVVCVTNEVGLGIVPENRLARIFRDVAGRVNQTVASAADEVYFVVSGIPMKVKG